MTAQEMFEKLGFEEICHEIVEGRDGTFKSNKSAM
jgi:hypothetical protein